MADLFVTPTSALTLAGASQIAKPGDTVHVAPGVYTGGFKTASSGTASAHITYVSDVAGGAKITGGSLTNDNDASWWQAGDYVDVRGFDISGAVNPAWRIGFYGSGSHTLFQGNRVHDIVSTSAAYNAAAANGLGGGGVVMDAYYGGVDASVIGNLVYNIGPTDITGNLVHGIYQVESGTVANNIVSSVIGVGIHLWHSSQNINIINNTVDNARVAGIVVGSGDGGGTSTTGDNVQVRNNIVTNGGYGIEEAGVTGIHNTYIDNLLWNNSGPNLQLQNGLVATGTIIADPLFVNRAALDYRLQATSPAIDSGTSLGAPATDFSGTARPQGGSFDIGAFEVVGGDPLPPPPPPPPPPPDPLPPPTVTVDTLVLLLSEDRFRGDAKFVATIDGATVAGPTSVTTLHGSGASQTFTYTGSWGVGVHDLAISFVNDDKAKSGKSGGDRNLYVDEVRFNGSVYPDDKALLTNGTVHFQVGQ